MKPVLLLSSLFLLLIIAISSCQKELSLETDQNLAQGTLYDTAGNCNPIITSGTYYNGVSASRDTNYIKLVVTVTQTGNYTISSNKMNGFGFSDTGYFSKLGTDTILLQAYGAPILNVPTDFLVSFDSSACGFTINVQDSTGTGLGGIDEGPADTDSSFTDPNPATANSWHFTDSSTNITYNGTFGVDQGGFVSNDTLYIVGQASTEDTLFGVSLVLPAATINPGIYPVNAGNIVLLAGSGGTTVIYGANDITTPLGTSNSYITITGYNSGQIAGSFHTWAYFNSTTPVLIAGSFNCIVR